ncbi:C4-dicarboxylate ABC transporter [Deltaproteobacteria bacterium Smac51]|nr:C4-dicarboxylate ABC transporter [Deltaproteobacteria bacterium Smac51]
MEKFPAEPLAHQRRPRGALPRPGARFKPEEVFLMNKKFNLAIIMSCFMVCGLFMTGLAGAAEKPIIIRVAHIEAEDRSTHKSLLKFKEYVEKESNGRLDVQIFPNGLLGGDKESIEGVELGTVQMSLPAVSVLASYDEKFGLLDMPFLFKSEEAIFNALDNEIGQDYDKTLDKLGFHNLGYNYNGPRCLSNNTRPINEPADLKGLKIRVMQSPVFIDMFNALGANPTPMSFGEIFTGLQQGTVTGQENAPSLTYASRFYEVQKYYSITNHTFSIMAILMNKDFFNDLPADLQEIMTRGADEYLIKYQRGLESSETADYIKLLADAGMEITYITPENHQKFVEAVQPVYTKNKPKIGEELFTIVEKYNK